MQPGRRLVALAAAACVVLEVAAGSAQAATVTVLYRNGHAHVTDNRFLTGNAADPELPAPPLPNLMLSPTAPALALASTARSPRTLATRSPSEKRGRRPRTVSFARALLELERRGALPATAYRSDLGAWRRALAEERRLPRWRAAQLADVTATLDEMAAGRRVTAGRLPVLMLTLANNARYWRSGPPLASRAAVQFQGSELVWEYYPGSGIQLQVLHTFGEGDGYYEAGPAHYPQLVTLMSEMVPLAVRRGGGLAWEYYFNWEGGRPPWVSAMAQATGLEALTNAYLATHNPQYLGYAHSALPLLETRPPTGVALQTPLGTRYLQYSFTPGTDIINAFLQTLVGLYDYEQVSLDPLANSLYNAGSRQAQAELRSFIVGGWSLYQPGTPDTLGYHTLVTGFLRLLCSKTQVPVYCTTYQQFAGDLLTRPQLTLLTTAVRAGRRFGLRFRLTKYAAVGVVLSRAGRNYLYTKRSFFAGTRSFATPRLRPGTYSLRMSVTDPAGHYASLDTTLEVCRRGCAAPPYAIAPPTTGTVPSVTVPLPPPSTTTQPTTTSTTTTSTTTTGTTTGTTTTGTTTGTTTTGTTTTGTTTSPTGGGGL